MIHPRALIKLYAYNAELINLQIEGMTHEESLLQLPFNDHCLNWLLGHVISARTRALHMVQETPVWTEEQRLIYRSGSTVSKDMVRLETLVADFNLSQERLVCGLEKMTYEQMCQSSGFQDNTIGDSLAYFQFHESHHVGQIVYLGQLAGKKGAWLS